MITAKTDHKKNPMITLCDCYEIMTMMIMKTFCFF